MRRKINVFVSSKMIELKAERAAIHALLPRLGGDQLELNPWVFEDSAPASDQTIREIYLNALREAGLYIGIFWNEYGEWTIDEFQRATEWRIPRHIYVKNLDSEKRDPRLQDFLDGQQEVSVGITHKWFSTTEELCAAVKTSIEAWLQGSHIYRAGSLSAVHINDVDSIPDRPRKLIGRDQLFTEIRAELNAGKQVLLQGFAGIGKTALAAAFTANWITEGRDSVLWLRLGSEDISFVFAALARPFGAQNDINKLNGDAQTAAIRHLFHDRKISLLVLDDAWNSETLQQVLKAIPSTLPVLITSRLRFPVESIIEVSELLPSDAVSTLSYYASADFNEDVTAKELCKTLGYHPYALEIAGKNIKVERVTPAELHKQIRVAPDAMKMPYDFAESGRESIAKLLEISLKGLNTKSRDVFLAYGALFAPSATEELLALYLSIPTPLLEIDPNILSQIRTRLQTTEVTEEELRLLGHLTALSMRNIETGEVTGALAQLIERGLVTQINATPESAAFFRIHDLTFSYVRALILDQHRDRALQACLSYMQRHAVLQKDPDVLRRFADNSSAAEDSMRASMNDVNFVALRPEVPNLVGAVDYSFRQEYATELRLLVGLCIPFFDNSGYFDLSVGLLKKAIAVERALGRHKDPLGNQIFLGITYSRMGNHQKAIEEFEQVLVLNQAVGDKDLQATCLSHLAAAYTDLGQPAQAIQHHEQALAINRELNSRYGEGWELSSIGRTYLRLHQEEKAIHCCEQSLSISQNIGDRRMEAAALGNLGIAYRQQGNPEQAISYLQHTLSINRELGDRNGETRTLQSLSNAYEDLGEIAQAEALRSRGIDLAETMGARQVKGRLLLDRASQYFQNHQIQEALECLDQALLISREIHNRHDEGLALDELSTIYYQTDQVDKAVACVREAQIIFRETGNQPKEAEMLNRLGILYGAQKDYPASSHYLEEAIVLRRRLGEKQPLADSLSNLMRAYFALGQSTQAIACGNEAGCLYQEIGQPEGKIQNLAIIGDILCSKVGDIDQAVTYYEKALEVCRETHNAGEEAKQLISLGQCYFALTQVPHAIDCLEQAVKVASETNDVVVKSRAMHGLGDIHFDQQQYDKAVFYYTQARDIYTQIGAMDQSMQLNRRLSAIEREHLTIDERSQPVPDENMMQQAMMLAPLMMISYSMGGEAAVREVLHNAPDAVVTAVIQQLKQMTGQTTKLTKEPRFSPATASKDSNSASAKIREGQQIGDLGLLYAEKGRWPEALDLLETSRRLFAEAGARRLEGAAIGNIASLYVEQGRYKAALDASREAREIFVEIGSTPDIEVTDMNIAKINRIRRNPFLWLLGKLVGRISSK